MSDWLNCRYVMTDFSPTVAVTTSKTSTRTSFRWVVIALAFFITIVNYLDRSAISYAIGPLKREFGLNDADFGMIAAAFGIGYIVMTFIGGILVDLYGARKMWAGSAILWSAVTALMGLASGYWMLFILRTGLGIAEGPNFPALTRVVADWMPASERARATAIGLAAVPLASVIGAPLLSHLIINCGWQTMFYILGGLGLIWVVAFVALFKDYPENSRFVSTAELHHIREGKTFSEHMSDQEIRQHKLTKGETTWTYMLFNPALLSNNIAFFAFGYLLFFALTWLPGYLESTYGLQLKQIGIFLIAPWLTAFVLLLLAGYLSDYLLAKTGSIRMARSHMIWVCQLLSALCFLPVVLVHSLPVAITFISLGVGIGLMPNACFYALNTDLAEDRAATSLGIMDCYFAAAGIAAPMLTGFMATATGNFNSAIILMMGFTVIAVLGVIFFQHPDQK